MALYDPEQAGNAAQYLRLDPVQLMEVRSAPFDGKILQFFLQIFTYDIRHNYEIFR